MPLLTTISNEPAESAAQVISIPPSVSSAEIGRISSGTLMDMSSSDTIVYENLAPGVYDVTITDTYGCTDIVANMPITGTSDLLINAPGSQISNVNCKFGMDGAINLNVIGGTEPIVFLWEDSQGDSIFNEEDLSGVAAGWYSVLVSDSVGCEASHQFEVTEPAELIHLDSMPPILENVSCHGFEDGFIQVFPSGGVSPYQYLWSTSDTTQSISNLAPGLYQVTITDQNNCDLISIDYEVTEPVAPLSLQEFFIDDVTCFGGDDGSIEISMTGGTDPYFYDWDLPAVTQNIFGIEAGPYYLFVQDANQCPFDTLFHVDQPDQIEIVGTSFPSDPGQATGMAIADASGGVGPYMYTWETGHIGDTLANVLPGTYLVTVDDANGCQSFLYVSVESLTSTSQAFNTLQFSFYPNPNNGVFQIELNASQASEFQIKITNAVGQTMYSQEVYAEELSQKTKLDDAAPGLYFVHLLVDGQTLLTRKMIVQH